MSLTLSHTTPQVVVTQVFPPQQMFVLRTPTQHILVPMSDLLQLAMYALTMSDLRRDDLRLAFVERVKTLTRVPGFESIVGIRPESERLEEPAPLPPQEEMMPHQAADEIDRNLHIPAVTAFIVHYEPFHGFTTPRMLLGFHVKSKSWLPPGGKVKPTESFDAALHREVLEEAGMYVRIYGGESLSDGNDRHFRDEHSEQCCTPIFIDKHRSPAGPYHLALCYIAKPEEAHRPEPHFHHNEEFTEMRWLRLDEINAILAIKPSVRRYCQIAMAAVVQIEDLQHARRQQSGYVAAVLEADRVNDE